MIGNYLVNENKMASYPKVLIGVPTMGSMHPLLTAIILKWCVTALQNKDKGVSFYPTVGVSPTDQARNEIVETLLSSDFTHLLFIDSDTIPPIDGLDRLLAHKKDIVSGITPIIEHDKDRKNDSSGFYKKWNAVTLDDKHTEPYKGLIRIRGVGSSFILIKREVFEKMPKPWYRFKYEDDSGKPIVVGEDIHFIIKAIALGYMPYADTDIVCGHHKGIIWQ